MKKLLYTLNNIYVKQYIIYKNYDRNIHIFIITNETSFIYK